MGGIIGAGIFVNPSVVARQVHTPLLVLGAWVIGGAICMVMTCDLMVSADTTKFMYPEAKVGVFPMQVLALLQAQVPQRHLAQLCLTGDPIGAERAREIGLVNEVADDLDGALERLLARVMANSPTALRRGLYAMKAMRSMSFAEAIAFAEGQIGLLAMTQDAREGLAAFQEKRKPQWTGQ